MDRNKEFLRRRGAQIANEKFARQLQAGESAVLDRFGNPIRTGSIVLWRVPNDLVFQVIRAEPLISLDPTRPVPPGMMTLLLNAGEIPYNCLANVPQMAMVHCGDVAPASDGGLTPPGETPPPPPEGTNHGAQ